MLISKSSTMIFLLSQQEPEIQVSHFFLPFIWTRGRWHYADKAYFLHFCTAQLQFFTIFYKTPSDSSKTRRIWKYL